MDNQGPPLERGRVYPWWPHKEAEQSAFCRGQTPKEKKEERHRAVFDQLFLTNSSKGRGRTWDKRSKLDYFYALLKQQET